MALINQIDVTPIIQGASEVRPGEGSGYGYLVAVLILLIGSMGFLIYILVRRMFKQEDARGSFIEKSLQISQLQSDLFKKVDDRLTVVEGKQDTTIAIAQAIIKDRA